MTTIDNQYGKNWPDTWIFFTGNPDSSALSENNILAQNPLNNTCHRLDPGRAFPKPEINNRDSYGIVFDGHLYNQKELSRALKIDEEMNQAELILEAYLLWGESFVSHLVGIFSFILWDDRNQLLLAVRDPVGIYPLFYAEANEGRFFSISIQALLAQQGISSTINRIVVALHLSLYWGRNEETFYNQIQRVPPGHLIQIRNCIKTQIHYWSPIRPDGKVEWLENATSEQFENLLQDVSRDFINYSPLGIYLSGGLDSIAAAGFLKDAAQRSGLRYPRAYSLVFPVIGEVEEPVQRGVSSSLELPLHITRLTDASGQSGLLQACFEMNQVWPTPMGNIWRQAYNYLGYQAIKDGCSAIITGVGGDEWLGLTPTYAADLMRKFDFPGLYRLILGMWHSWPFPLRTHLYNGIWKYGSRLLISRWISRLLLQVNPTYLRKRRKNSLYRTIPEWFTPDMELQEEISQRYDERVEQSLVEDKIEDFYFKGLTQILFHPVSSMELEEEFENGRRLGIPILGFYQHQELISYLFRFPPHLLNTGRPQKGLVREILQQRFPDLGLQKQKKISATSNFHEVVLQETGAVWDQLEGIQSLARIGIVNPRKSDTFISTTLNDPAPKSMDIWMLKHLIIYETWLRNRENSWYI